MRGAPGGSLPAALHGWPLWLAGSAVILLGGALASIWLGRRHSRKAKIVWTIAAIFIPVLGPIAWFLLGRETRRR
ncbi:MAG TPA: PLD nuclease N-terminal domain-containing protein [Gemmatimonadaceae bacterium]|nr:PLD nuclease N-terminal domain-containing protein [Gemmatimonadaceae bacterium]